EQRYRMTFARRQRGQRGRQGHRVLEARIDTLSEGTSLAGFEREEQIVGPLILELDHRETTPPRRGAPVHAPQRIARLVLADAVEGGPLAAAGARLLVRRPALGSQRKHVSSQRQDAG